VGLLELEQLAQRRRAVAEDLGLVPLAGPQDAVGRVVAGAAGAEHRREHAGGLGGVVLGVAGAGGVVGPHQLSAIDQAVADLLQPRAIVEAQLGRVAGHHPPVIGDVLGGGVVVILGLGGVLCEQQPLGHRHPPQPPGVDRDLPRQARLQRPGGPQLADGGVDELGELPRVLPGQDAQLGPQPVPERVHPRRRLPGVRPRPGGPLRVGPVGLQFRGRDAGLPTGGG
jgi:hypothetical protein